MAMMMMVHPHRVSGSSRSMAGTTVLLAATVLATGVGRSDAATPFKHGWGTVGDVMGMHGKFDAKDGASPDMASIAFAAKHYPQITTGTGCYQSTVNTTFTIEDAVLAVQARVKAINSSVKTGMYFRTPFALELATCSHFSKEWNSHPEYRLMDDNGKPVMQGSSYFIDYSNPAAADFFATVVLAMLSPTLPSGRPILDYVYLDGSFTQDTSKPYAKGIGPTRTASLNNGKLGMVRSMQARLDAKGFGQILVLNGMDDIDVAAAHVASGAAGSMFDHWSILQFLDRNNGDFNATLMDEAISLAQSTLLSNITTQIKGWPGPIIRQRDQYPPNMKSPNTTEEFQDIAKERFNSELALFLLVASEFDFWIYSWFWDWYDYIPGNSQSTVPSDFFPEYRCPLGAPKGPGTRVAGTWTYNREFESASVHVDLLNRTASRVTYEECSF